MASDYQAIRLENQRRYGTDIGRIGPMLLADRYDDRTHFIFELLQNAEDALARRDGWQGSRAVSFHLTEKALRVSHFGLPFDERDVRGICGIAESTKDLTAIGRFGIGFKSVYAFTDRPRIHSGAEDFAIENFVWPVAVEPIQRSPDETVIVIPLKPEDSTATAAITSGLQRLGARTLLFLREVEEIYWIVEDGPSGFYLRGKPAVLGDAVRQVTLLGQEEGKDDVEENWLVFSRPVTREEGAPAGPVGLAFLLDWDEENSRGRIRPISQSPLVVFFPTVLETHLGFLVQGPFRTTPSRDNVPRDDSWNQHCVQEIARLLGIALRWLRDHGLLDTDALRCLPLDRTKFGGGSMFAPLFDATKHLLTTEPILPCFGGGHVPAVKAKLARTQELRGLFDTTRLIALFDAREELAWLSGDISQDRTPDLRQYLMRELDIAEVTPEAVLPRLSADFLNAQSDDWILRLYEFLNGQPALRGRAKTLPLIRLVDGSHVPALEHGRLRVFLPSGIETGFPTVRPAVCASDAARAFLRSLGLTEPDPVDDVVWNVLPRYGGENANVTDEVYEADIRRILTAFGTDSKAQRDKLITALREAAFVMAVDTKDARKRLSKPGHVYIATERLKELFAGVPGVLLVDDRYECLQGEDVRELLEACGAVRYLRPVEDTSLSWDERKKLREQAGHVQTSGQNDRIVDHTLLGLPEVLNALPKLSAEERRTRASLIWEELAYLEERRGKGVFTGECTWTHRGSYRTTFDVAFVRLLNEKEWVPDAEGSLQRPGMVLFESLGWNPHPFLLSKIRFKPPIIDQLAKEAGIEPGVIDLLKKLGVTSEAELRARLGVRDEPVPGHGTAGDSVEDAVKKLLGKTPTPTPPVPDPAAADPVPAGSDHAAVSSGTSTGLSGRGPTGAGAEGGPLGEGRGKSAGQGEGQHAPGSTDGRPFISYVAVHPDEREQDPDSLDQGRRMELEEAAIRFILSREPNWRRTQALNPGFDLLEVGPDGRPTRWCEVKAMTGGLEDRPVGLSRAQFECAREHGEDYWLYIVEHAGDDNARLVRIQDPAGKARTFTFDHGWLAVADVDSDSEEGGDQRAWQRLRSREPNWSGPASTTRMAR